MHSPYTATHEAVETEGQHVWDPGKEKQWKGHLPRGAAPHAACMLSVPSFALCWVARRDDRMVALAANHPSAPNSKCAGKQNRPRDDERFAYVFAPPFCAHGIGTGLTVSELPS